jgi:hypothetical protein
MWSPKFVLAESDGRKEAKHDSRGRKNGRNPGLLILHLVSPVLLDSNKLLKNPLGTEINLLGWVTAELGFSHDQPPESNLI